MFKKRYIKAAAIALACLVLSGTAVYAGRGMTWYGYGRPGEYTSYSGIGAAFEKAGIDASAPETLPHGFTFKEASINTFGQMDDGNKKISKYQGVDVYYTDAEGQKITLVIEPVVTGDSDEEPVAQREIADGIVARFDSHEMLTVPSRDEVSEEDAMRELTDPKFWISEGGGSTETERQIYNNVRFEIGDVSYDILGFDLDLTQDEMFELAKAVAEQNL